MIGTTLSDIREHIESLASESGRYYLACARFGDRPVPADDLTFRSRAVAWAAARATEQYHATLRRYDPHAPYYDVIVCEDHPDPTAPSDGPSTLDGECPASDDTALSGPATDELIDVCHTVAGVVFEAIANSSHVGLENAVMETISRRPRPSRTRPNSACGCYGHRDGTRRAAQSGGTGIAARRGRRQPP